MRAALFASVALSLSAITSLARADFATPPDGAVVMLPRGRDVPKAVAAEPDEHLWIAAKFEGGASLRPREANGGFGRFSVELLSTGTRRETGFAYGFWYGVEGWGAPKIGGAGIPVVLQAGVKTTHFVGLLGAGFNLFTLDKTSDGSGDGKYGGGIFSPRASARLGLHFDPVYVELMGDVQRRWAWGLPDSTMFQAGIAFGVMVGANQRPRRAPAVARW